MTSLNLFATRFDQVLEFVQKRSADHEFVLLFRMNRSMILVDTPGQIEVFTWSASGTIITEALSSTLPTILLYVIDTPRSSQPITFMSNMLYACSIMYRMHLPMVIVFNKADIQDYGTIETWMRDYEVPFPTSWLIKGLPGCDQRDEQRQLHDPADAFDGIGVGRVLQHVAPFLPVHRRMHTVGVSSVTGEGVGDLLVAIEEAKKEYFSLFLPSIRVGVNGCA